MSNAPVPHELVKDFLSKVDAIGARALTHAKSCGIRDFNPSAATEEELVQWILDFWQLQKANTFEPLLSCWNTPAYQWKDSSDAAEREADLAVRWHTEAEFVFIWMWLRVNRPNYRVAVRTQNLVVVSGSYEERVVGSRVIETAIPRVHNWFFGYRRRNNSVTIDLLPAAGPASFACDSFDLMLGREGSEWSVMVDLVNRPGEDAESFGERVEIVPDLLVALIGGLSGVNNVYREDSDLIVVSVAKRSKFDRLIREALNAVTEGALAGLTIDPDVDEQ